MGGYRITDPDTARRAYWEMESSGALKGARLEVVRSLAFKPGSTAGELAVTSRSNRNNVATRLSELEHLGVVAKAGERRCSVSGKVCVTWRMTGSGPVGKIVRRTGRTAKAVALMSQVADALDDTSVGFNRSDWSRRIRASLAEISKG